MGKYFLLHNLTDVFPKKEELFDKERCTQHRDASSFWYLGEVCAIDQRGLCIFDCGNYNGLLHWDDELAQVGAGKTADAPKE